MSTNQVDLVRQDTGRVLSERERQQAGEAVVEIVPAQPVEPTRTTAT